MSAQQDVLNLDKYIEKLLNCEFLPASDIKALCEKVLFSLLFSKNSPFIGKGSS